MSYTLEIYALDWRKLGEALSGGLAPPDPYMPGWRRLNPDIAEQAALARTWAAAASELKRRLDEGDGEEDRRLSAGALRAFVATVRTLGALCGTLGHASASGAEAGEAPA